MVVVFAVVVFNVIFRICSCVSELGLPGIVESFLFGCYESIRKYSKYIPSKKKKSEIIEKNNKITKNVDIRNLKRIKRLQVEKRIFADLSILFVRNNEY
jgi:hypothetical protein